MKRSLLGALLAPLLAWPAAADFERGKAAFQAGDFKTARSEWEKSALAGDADAQFELGKMLANGIGTRKDYITAYAWLFLADKGGARGAAQYHELLEQKYVPRYCMYEAVALIRDYEHGMPERLVANVDRNASKCWGHSPPR